jgi:hypothetical protein
VNESTVSDGISRDQCDAVGTSLLAVLVEMNTVTEVRGLFLPIEVALLGCWREQLGGPIACCSYPACARCSISGHCQQRSTSPVTLDHSEDSGDHATLHAAEARGICIRAGRVPGSLSAGFYIRRNRTAHIYMYIHRVI